MEKKTFRLQKCQCSWEMGWGSFPLILLSFTLLFSPFQDSSFFLFFCCCYSAWLISPENKADRNWTTHGIPKTRNVTTNNVFLFELLEFIFQLNYQVGILLKWWKALISYKPEFKSFMVLLRLNFSHSNTGV